GGGRARSVSGKKIHQRQCDELKAVGLAPMESGRALHKRPRLGMMDLDVGMVIELAAPAGKAATQKSEQVGSEFDGMDRGGAVAQCCQDTRPGPRPEDEHRALH